MKSSVYLTFGDLTEKFSTSILPWRLQLSRAAGRMRRVEGTCERRGEGARAMSRADDRTYTHARVRGGAVGQNSEGTRGLAWAPLT
jgi:hypothetical protein